MPELLKVLGQAALATTTLTAVYTVPANTRAVLSSIVIANRDGSATDYRVAIAVAGAANDNKQYIAYDVDLPANESAILGKGITLGPGDVVRVYTSGSAVSVNVFGTEVT